MPNYRDEGHRTLPRENYLEPFLKDVGRAGKAIVNAVRGKKSAPVDAGIQLMGTSLTPRQRKSTKGSPEFTDKEIMKGYRKL